MIHHDPEGHIATDVIANGRLVLVTGPSGAGKDSVIAAAKLHWKNNPRFVFPQRIVTRAPSRDEGHASMSASDFGAARANGVFAMHWNAHGLSYGIPATIGIDITAGSTVICNVSRSVVAAARERFGTVVCVEITAPEEILRARLIARGRESSTDITARLSRQFDADRLHKPDLIIQNAKAIEAAVREFVTAIGTSARRRASNTESIVRP